MASNRNLHSAKAVKNDEFYTELSEIEKELCYYKDKFKGKVVFCNCDDPFESNFVKFFLMHFNGYGLKALYATGYLISEIANTELKVGENNLPYFLCVEETSSYLKGDQKDLDMKSSMDFIKEQEEKAITKLYGDKNYVAGDFRSQESVEILKKCDIVVTNPPFSLFREYVAQLIKFNKDFLIIGNKNAITYKEIYSLFKNNNVWWGCTNPDIFRNIHGDIVNKMKGLSRWYTTLDHENRHKMLEQKAVKMGHTYKNHESDYVKYDNFDAINIDKVDNIPIDYSGVMGVPITFLDKYCPDQFEIVGWSRHNDLNMDGGYWLGGKNDATVNGKIVYRRILIKRKDMN